jgi:hypothetical protein
MDSGNYVWIVEVFQGNLGQFVTEYFDFFGIMFVLGDFVDEADYSVLKLVLAFAKRYTFCVLLFYLAV